MTASRQPALIGLDWGTSKVRGYLLSDEGGVLHAVVKPWGIQHLPAGGFEAAFAELLAGLPGHGPACPVVAAGMVGSRQGWHEVPYVSCPADALVVAGGLLAFDAGSSRMHLVPGVIQRGPLPNVLRGEETQIFGALAQGPSLAAESLVVLPGTHSKWVRVMDGRIVGFDTYMTGELFAVLRDHSLLGNPAREAAGEAIDTGERAAAFARGLAVAHNSGPGGVAARLFTTRSLYLTGGLAPQATLDYLSGLLVGEEIRSALAVRADDPAPSIVLVGDESLCRRYRDALTAFGLPQARVHGDSAAAGLWRIAKAAGLVSSSCGLPGSASHG